ncbi:MAG: FMN-binding protein [Planctomycetota bacterium]|jgi:electron transport complex protein RnfG
MLKIKHFIQQSWLLIVASFLFGLLIAIASAAWTPRIERNEEEKKYSRMRELIVDANSFEIAINQVEIRGEKGKILRTDIYEAFDSNGISVGFAFVAEGPGFQDKIKVVIAVDRKCEKFFGFKVLSSNETPGFGNKIEKEFFGEQFQKASVGKLNLVKAGNAKEIDSQIVAITGATVSSEAVVKIFNTYIETIKERLQTEGLIGNGK